MELAPIHLLAAYLEIQTVDLLSLRFDSRPKSILDCVVENATFGPAAMQASGAASERRLFAEAADIQCSEMREARGDEGGTFDSVMTMSCKSLIINGAGEGNLIGNSFARSCLSEPIPVI